MDIKFEESMYNEIIIALKHLFSSMMEIVFKWNNKTIYTFNQSIKKKMQLYLLFFLNFIITPQCCIEFTI